MQEANGWTRAAVTPRPGAGAGAARRADVVAIAQQLLRAEGAPHLEVDGRVDAATTAAVRAFQERHGLAVDGVAGSELVAALRRVRAGEPAAPARPVEPVVPIAPPAVPVAPPAPPVAPPAQPFPLNRVVAFLGPYIAVASGVLAAWVGRHFPGLEVDPGQTTIAITQAAEFALGATITWALHHKWLDGWSTWEAAVVAANRTPS